MLISTAQTEYIWRVWIKPKDFFTVQLLRTYDMLMYIINLLEMCLMYNISQTHLAVDPLMLMNHLWIQNRL